MRLEVFNAIQTLLTSDKSVSPRERREILAVCRGTQTAQNAPRMLSAKEIADKFHILAGRKLSYDTIRRWGNAGRLPFVQVSSNRRMYKEEDVLRIFCGETNNNNNNQ